MLKKQKVHVKVGDIVVIISGFHKNETGEIMKIIRKQERFLLKELISNLNMLNQIQRMKLEKLNNLKLLFIIQM